MSTVSHRRQSCRRTRDGCVGLADHLETGRCFVVVRCENRFFGKRLSFGGLALPILFEQLGQRGMHAFQRAARVHPPVGGPDANDLPAQAAQDLFAQFVPVTRGSRAVVGRTVAFHPREVATRKIRVHHAQVHAERRSADSSRIASGCRGTAPPPRGAAGGRAGSTRAWRGCTRRRESARAGPGRRRFPSACAPARFWRQHSSCLSKRAFAPPRWKILPARLE